MIRAIAIDDEPVALDIILEHSREIPFLSIEQVFYSASDALRLLETNPMDLVFVDISMPGLSGLEFADIVKGRVHVIFTTAFAEHALKGFDLAATDYLLKPIQFNRFLQACKLVESRLSNNNTEHDTLLVKDGYNWVPVKLEELLYVRGDDNYISLVTSRKRIVTRMTMRALLEQLPESKFARVHKSYIVCLKRIEKIEKHQIIVGHESIPLSLISAEALMQLIR